MGHRCKNPLAMVLLVWKAGVWIDKDNSKVMQRGCLRFDGLYESGGRRSGVVIILGFVCYGYTVDLGKGRLYPACLRGKKIHEFTEICCEEYLTFLDQTQNEALRMGTNGMRFRPGR